ncbi:MAG: LytR/AlgR family response regulator transcription factor [Nostocoides sp.]
MSDGEAAPAGLTVLLVDDEPPALSELEYLLGLDGRIESIHTASSGTDALRVLEEEHVDVIFSDVNMPGLDGMALARVVARFAERPQIVFVTAYDEHAVDAFSLEATDYVMKPVRQERLAEAVRRVVAGHIQPGRAGHQDVADETIPVELGGVTRFVNRSEIQYAKAQGDYARLFTASSNHLVRIPLSTLETRWADAGFVRIHRSTLVATGYIDEVRTDRGRISVMVGGVELQVSRRHTRLLRDRLIRQAP